jgi:hypothetical protein
MQEKTDSQLPSNIGPFLLTSLSSGSVFGSRVCKSRPLLVLPHFLLGYILLVQLSTDLQIFLTQS